MELCGRKITVTGGAGFIGSHVVDRLLEVGAHVVVLDDFSVGSRDNLVDAARAGRNLTIEAGDVRDARALERALAGCDVVIHMAVECLRASFAQPERVHEVNATGTVRMLEGARASGVARVVYVSSSEVYGSAQRVPMSEDHPLVPTTPYGASKAAGEHYARAWHTTFGLPTCVVRPFNAYGPRAHSSGVHAEVIPKFALAALAGVPPTIFGTGTQTRDFTFVTDTACGIVAAAACDALVGKTVNVARGEEVSVSALAAKVLAAAGRADLVLRFEAPRPADVSRHVADVSSAASLLGFRAEVGIDDGLGRYLSWLRAWLAARELDPGELIERDAVRNWDPVAP